MCTGSWWTTAEASGAQAVCHCLDFEEGQEGTLLQPGQTCCNIYKHRQLLDLAVSPSPRANSGWEGNLPDQDPLFLLPWTRGQHVTSTESRFRHSG